MLRLLWAASALALVACQSPSGFVSGATIEAPGNGAASGSERHTERIRRVTDRVMPAVEAHCAGAPAASTLDRPACRFPVLITPSPNAFASSNGERIRVSAGFSRFVLSDAELAFVIAHEAAHLLLRHSVGVDAERRQAQELEADRMGLMLLARAGYEPEAAVNLLRRMASSGSFAQSDASHPALSYRAELLRAALESDRSHRSGQPRAR